MKRIYIIIMLLCLATFTKAQTGIGTTSPNANSVLELNSTSQGMKFPRLSTTQRTNIANPAKGLTVFDTDMNCLITNFGTPTTPSWKCLGIRISSLNCAGATLTGTIPVGSAVGAGVTMSVPYTGGAGGAYLGQTINSTGVTGLVATLAAGNFANGNGNLTFTITGNASGYGTASFPISVGGNSCTLKTILTPNFPLGSGTLEGRICFDVALSNDNSNGCGALASRTSSQANFTQSSTYTQTYTFTPAATVSNVRFVYVNTNGNVIVSLTGGNPGNNISSGTAINATVNYSQTLNTDALGLTNANSLTADIYAIYNDGATNNGTDRMVKLTTFVNDCGCCMAKITPTQYATFLCHNLGADISLDPHTPVVGLQGAYIQWGRRGPNTTGNSVVDWQTAPDNGPLGFGAAPTAGNSNAGTIASLLTSDAPEFSWRTATGLKTANDPCPTGYRVPTKDEWTAVNANNVVSRTGVWTSSNTNYSTALHYGSSASNKTLTIPVTGKRNDQTGVLGERGQSIYYWSSTASGNPVAAHCLNANDNINSTWDFLKQYLMSVRCIKEYPATIASLNCGSSTPTGSLMANSPASGTYQTIPYTVGNNVGIAAGSVTAASTGVTGLTATVRETLMGSAGGNVIFDITGTPSAAGTATFNITIGGQSCSITRTVSAYTIPASITLAQNQKKFIASVNDNNYLPYTAPTVAATLATNVNPDATTEPTTVNVQGVITTAGISASIPVTCIGTGTLPAYSSAIVNVPAQYTEDGIARDIQLSWASLSYTTATTSLPVTIKAIGGDLNLKKLDINAGIGNDYLGILFASFTHPYNNSGATTSYTLHDIPGIPDRMFGVADNGGSNTSHNFLYLPVQGEDGNIWLNNNLGAEYNKLGSANFNPAQQATSATDYKAYGSQFQWGRKPDGHELLTWTTSTTRTSLYGVTAVNAFSDSPSHAKFINLGQASNWRVTNNTTLWSGLNAINNPCPYGFRVPTYFELVRQMSASGVSGTSEQRTKAVNSNLKFPQASYRNLDGGELASGTIIHIWSSDNSTTPSIMDNASNYSLNSSNTNMFGYHQKGYGENVRCIVDYAPVLGAITCTPSSSPGTLIANSPASGVSVTVAYPANAANKGYVNPFTVTSTGVTGLTASYAGGEMLTAGGNIVFNITGTPTSAGTATFNFTIGGQSCSFTREVKVQNSGFESASGCIVNGSVSAWSSLFSSTYKSYHLNTANGLDLLGDCDLTYGSAWSGNKYAAIAYNEGMTIDLGGNLIPGTTFTFRIYVRKAFLYPFSPVPDGMPLIVGLSPTEGVSGGAGLNNLYSIPQPSSTSWTPVDITFTVPSTPINLRYLTIEANAPSGWTNIDF